MKMITHYECGVCGERYGTTGEAEHCEATPVRESKGVKIGDRVRITSGDGVGLLCEVSEIYVLPPSWGPTKYSHTECVSGKVIDSWGSRMLAFDSYVVPEKGESDAR